MLTNSRITYYDHSQKSRIGECMKGNIYSDQKCRICIASGNKGTLVHDKNTRSLYCKEHPEQIATDKYKIKFDALVKK